MLTASKQSSTGYWIESLRKHVYSLEEINYFIYHHIDLIYRDFFSDAFFSWVEKELDQPLMARDMRRMAETGGTTGDFVRYLLNESWYYSSRELADISLLVANIDSMGKAERLKIQGDAHYRSGRYNAALQCYLEILKNRENEELSNSFYGRVAYGAGTVYARLFMGKSANTFFALAYDLSPDPVYAKACVYMSILAEDDEELLSAIVKYKISDDALDTMKKRVQATRKEVEAGEGMTALAADLADPSFGGTLVEEWKQQYYEMMK